MAGFPKRSFIDSRHTGYETEPSAHDFVRSQGIIDRHARAAEATAANGGRSAPQSDASRAGGLTPIDDWRRDFPKAPSVTTFSRPSLISARDAAMNASPAPYTPLPRGTKLNLPTPLTGPGGNAATDAAQLAQNLRLAANPRSLISARTASPAPGISPAAPAPVAIPKAPFDPGAARASLYASTDPRHQAIFQEGTPENAAFVAHAREFGEESAHRNLNDILPPAATPAPAQVAAATPRSPVGLIDPYAND